METEGSASYATRTGYRSVTKGILFLARCLSTRKRASPLSAFVANDDRPGHFFPFRPLRRIDRRIRLFSIPFDTSRVCHMFSFQHTYVQPRRGTTLLSLFLLIALPVAFTGARAVRSFENKSRTETPIGQLLTVHRCLSKTRSTRMGLRARVTHVNYTNHKNRYPCVDSPSSFFSNPIGTPPILAPFPSLTRQARSSLERKPWCFAVYGKNLKLSSRNCFFFFFFLFKSFSTLRRFIYRFVRLER